MKDLEKDVLSLKTWNASKNVTYVVKNRKREIMEIVFYSLLMSHQYS